MLVLGPDGCGAARSGSGADRGVGAFGWVVNQIWYVDVPVEVHGDMILWEWPGNDEVVVVEASSMRARPGLDVPRYGHCFVGLSWPELCGSPCVTAQIWYCKI